MKTLELIKNIEGFETVFDLIKGFENSSLKGELEIDYTKTFDTLEHPTYSKNNNTIFGGNEIYFSKLKLKRGKNEKKNKYNLNSIELFIEVVRNGQKIELEQYLILVEGDLKKQNKCLLTGRIDKANEAKEVKEQIVYDRLQGSKEGFTNKLIKVKMTAKEFFEKI